MHFNVHVDPEKGETPAEELRQVISEQIVSAANSTEAILGDLVIDANSLEVQGKRNRGVTFRGKTL